MTEAERHLLEALVRRLDILKRTVEAMLKNGSAIHSVLAFNASLVVRTLIVMLGDKLGATLLQNIIGEWRENSGVCSMCMERLIADVQVGVCAPCLAYLDAQEREAEEFEKMERPDTGKAH